MKRFPNFLDHIDPSKPAKGASTLSPFFVQHPSPVRGAWLSKLADEKMRRFIGFHSNEDIDKFFTRLTKEKSMEDVLEKLGSPNYLLEEMSTSDSGASDLGASGASDCGTSFRTPTKEARVVLTDINSPSTPEGEYHTSLDYSDASASVSEHNSPCTCTSPAKAKNDTPVTVRPITLSEVVSKYKDEVITISDSDDDDSQQAPTSPRSMQSSNTSTVTPKSSPEPVGAAPKSSPGSGNSVLRDSAAGHTFDLGRSEASLDLSHLRRSKRDSRCPSRSPVSSDNSYYEELRGVVKRLQPLVTKTPPTKRRPENSPSTMEVRQRRKKSRWDISQDEHQRQANIRQMEVELQEVPFPALSPSMPSADFERLAARRVIDFFVPRSNGTFARLLKDMCNSVGGNSASDRARTAIVRILQCFKKLELPDNILPELNSRQDYDLKDFISTTIRDVVDRIIEKTRDARFEDNSKLKSPTPTVEYNSHGFYVWESPELMQQDPSAPVLDATNNATTDSLVSPLAQISPPAFASSPLSPDSTTTDPPPAPTPWAGSLRSRCINRSRCLAATPSQRHQMVPVIEEAASISHDVFNSLPTEPASISDIVTENTEAVMAVMSIIQEDDVDQNNEAALHTGGEDDDDEAPLHIDEDQVEMPTDDAGPTPME